MCVLLLSLNFFWSLFSVVLIFLNHGKGFVVARFNKSLLPIKNQPFVGFAPIAELEKSSLEVIPIKSTYDTF